MRHFFLLIILVLSVPCFGVITVNVGQTSIDFKPQLQWAVSRLNWAGEALIEDHAITLSSQGTVMEIRPYGQGDYIWVGSGHGHEQVISTELLLDSQAAEIIDTNSYSADAEAVFTRTTNIADAWLLKSTMTVRDGFVSEHVKLTAINTVATFVKTAYVFLGSRNNNFEQYASFDSNFQIISSGQTDANEDSFFYIGSPVAVSQYSSQMQTGIVSALTIGYSSSVECYIWDRAWDNKLYFLFNELAGYNFLGDEHEYTQNLICFKARPEFFNEISSHLVQNPDGPLKKADANLDGSVDIYDFLILKSNYGTTSGATQLDGDFDCDGDVDIFDFLILKSFFGI